MLSWLEKLITERGSAAVLRERNGLITTERDVALRKLADALAKIAQLEQRIAELEVDKRDLQAKADELRLEVKMLRDFLPQYLQETDPALVRRLRGEEPKPSG